MKLPVIVRPEAEMDLVQIRDWYESQQVGLGRLFAERASAAIDQIGEFPELYGEVEIGVRAAPIHRHPHIAYYRTFSDRVEVLAVLHGARDPDTWKNRASDR